MGIFKSSKNLTGGQLAIYLKGICVNYVCRNMQDEFFESDFGKQFLQDDEDHGVDNIPVMSPMFIMNMDNFILLEEASDGRTVLDKIIGGAKLNIKEREILRQWEKQAFPSVFEVKEISDDVVKAMDLLAEVDYDIHFNDPSKAQELIKKISIGDFVYSNILPVNGTWFFSGVQNILGKESERVIFDTCIVKASERQIFRNNPEKLQLALKNQKEHYNIFVKTFGSDEVIVTPDQFDNTLQRYYDNLVFHFGCSENKLVAPKMPEDFEGALTIGIIADEREGQHEFSNYGEFVRIFETGDDSEASHDFIIDCLEDESTPAFIFRKMKDKYPENFNKIMFRKPSRGSHGICPTDSFDKMMDMYKPDWHETYPSVMPMNHRFEKYYRNNLSRNDKCYCGSGKKFKKCHGK